MSEHSEQADKVEREIDELQHDSDKLGEEISEARGDWEQKKHDDAVPGAGGDPIAAERGEDGPPPEADDTSSGD